jgi:hypothetical protein
VRQQPHVDRLVPVPVPVPVPRDRWRAASSSRAHRLPQSAHYPGGPRASRIPLPKAACVHTWRTITAFLPACRPCSMTTTFPDFKLRSEQPKRFETDSQGAAGPLGTCRSGMSRAAHRHAQAARVRVRIASGAAGVGKPPRSHTAPKPAHAVQVLRARRTAQQAPRRCCSRPARLLRKAGSRHPLGLADAQALRHRCCRRAKKVCRELLRCRRAEPRTTSRRRSKRKFCRGKFVVHCPLQVAPAGPRPSSAHPDPWP